MNENSLPISQSTDAMTIISIDNAIKHHLSNIAKIKEDIKTEKEMIDSMLTNNPKYVEDLENAKSTNKEKNATKQQLLKTPQAAPITQKIKDLALEVKDLQNGLSHYLQQYSQLTGATEFEDEEGELRQIIYVAKLVRKSTK